MNAAEQTRAFCSALFAGDATPDGELAGQHAVVFVLPSKRNTWVPLDDLDRLVETITAADRGQTQGVYVSMVGSTHVERAALPDDSGGTYTGRVTNDTADALFGVWADLDVAGPAHTSGKLPPDRAAVMRILAEMRLEPSLVWDSGNGLQALWLLDNPWVIESDGERAEAAGLVRDWLRTVAAHAHRIGRWKVDAVHDLARVLRVPGTTNRKRLKDGTALPVRPVELLVFEPDRRYTTDQLNAACLDREILDQHEAMVRPGKGDSALVDLGPIWRLVNSAAYRERRYEAEWWSDVLDELRELGTAHASAAMIVKIWEHSGRGQFGDHSRADASMARRLADLDVDERDVAEILMCMRLRTGHKVEKVQPTKRGQDYLVGMTIGKTFASARKAAQERTVALDAAQQAAAAELAAQREEDARAVAARRAAAAERADHGRTELDPEHGMSTVTGLAGHAVATYVQHEPQKIVSEPGGGGCDPPIDAPSEEPDGSGPEQPVDEPSDATDDAPQPDPDTPDPETLDDDLPPPAPRALPAASPPGPGRSPFPPRTETQISTLKALTADLFEEDVDVEIYALQQRGRGADAKRRIMLRPGPDFGYAVSPPEGFRPGLPFYTGWWPLATFNKAAGWKAAIESDCNIVVRTMNADTFRERYSRVLVRLWEPDNSGGSLASVTADALRRYLVDYPPVRDWGEARQVGSPWLLMQSDAWTPDHTFAVLVRWMDFGRFVRANYSLQVGPTALAEMAELVGAIDAVTPEQDGRWKSLHRDFFTDRTWAAILENARLAAARREDRRGGLHLVDGTGGDDEGMPRDGTQRLRGRR